MFQALHLVLYPYTISFHPCTPCTVSAILIPILQVQNLTRFFSNHSAKARWKSSCLTSKDIPFTTMISCFSSSLLLHLLQLPLDFPIHLHTTSLGAVIPQVRPLPTHHRRQGKPRDLGQTWGLYLSYA